MKFSRSVSAKLAVVAVALAAAGTASVAQARVFASVGVNIAPGIVIGASNAPVYYPPVYPQPYYAPAPVYYEPAYYAPAPVFYGPPVFIGGRWIHGGGRHFVGHSRGFRGNGHHR